MTHSALELNPRIVPQLAKGYEVNPKGVDADAPQREQYQLAVPANSLLASGYGLGFSVTRQDNYIAFGHNGAVAGYQAGLEINRDAEKGVIVLANAIGPGTVSAGDCPRVSPSFPNLVFSVGESLARFRSITHTLQHISS